MEQNKLKSDKTDLIASAAKSVVGAVPIVGSLLTELVGTIIPNQRIDRLSKYLVHLETKLSAIPIDKVNLLLSNAGFIDLIEEGFTQASRAITDERRIYIATLISNGISSEKLQLEESKSLLRLLQELSDIEIIWLRHYLVGNASEDNAFREKHKNLLTNIPDVLGADELTKTKMALQQSYKGNLERLKLISYIYQVDKKTGIPKLNTYTGEQSKAATLVTTLGRLLLKEIGIINELYPEITSA